jgi:hypothetical protein
VLIYKEGRLHSNVDVFSRPVLNVELIYTIDLSAKDDFAFKRSSLDAILLEQAQTSLKEY